MDSVKQSSFSVRKHGKDPTVSKNTLLRVTGLSTQRTSQAAIS
jgi:hypothetical protein